MEIAAGEFIQSIDLEAAQNFSIPDHMVKNGLDQFENLKPAINFIIKQLNCALIVFI